MVLKCLGVWLCIFNLANTEAVHLHLLILQVPFGLHT